ncbi:lipoprotein-releasing ABC transporter permease subunit [Kangiella sp. HZ709]|uniref:lipoprotein-releasing ABC transporter permease subunit n=1 Tax=Kangiella sp. HZ709 TaxID=2666328 RepID=UPI0012B06D82|nr:lipoprotein-releasing ABC transporter permease subunit [Kangiella sp. HZ709]MRX26950.1 lipoprotein-releasing ABC transporter permease subunit [Kangiella sp. HZ709]
MKLPFSLFVGLRYTRAKRRDRFISLISIISMVGIALGVMVLITVMSVMNGFERELRDRILGVSPHVLVQDFSGELKGWQEVEEKVKQSPQILGASPYIQSETMFRHFGLNQVGMVQGILPEKLSEVSVVPANMKAGSIDDLEKGKYNIILGSTLSRRLAAGVGDKVTLLILSQTKMSLAGINTRSKRFTVVGIFDTKSEVDQGLAFVHMDDAASVLRIKDGVTALQLKTQDVMKAYDTAYEVNDILKGDYLLSDWTRQHQTLFNAIDMEKKIMFILLIFIIMVAAFNIVTSLVMLVNEKQSDIAILRTLGASPASVMKIFMTSGFINGLIGTVVGVVLGMLLATYLPDIVSWIEVTFDVRVFPQNVYFVNELPTHLIMKDVIQIGIYSFAISLFATIYPAWKASRIQPAEALRYE